MTRPPKKADRLRKIVAAFPRVTVTVLGDMVADEFIFGEISRVSREAPAARLCAASRPTCTGSAYKMRLFSESCDTQTWL